MYLYANLSVISLFPRDCVKCDDSSQLSCPTCPSNQECQFTVPTDCSQCAQAVCVEKPTSGSGNSDSSGDSDGGGGGGGGGGPNAGAIAGGVIAGVVVLALLTYLAWRFLIKPKRSEEAARQSAYSSRGTNNLEPVDGSEKDAASRMTRRSSTHTVHSIASTVLTRASNIIQIAYIPGVTNRANSNTQSSGSMLVPPVPPIPMEHGGSGASTPAAHEDQHFFMPGDLRDSTYSGLSGYTDRNSYATRASYAPRSSIASTIYGKQAQVMTPASTGMRAKPTMVSVKSIGVSGGDTPPVPDVDYDRFNGPAANLTPTNANRPQSTASNFSVGSTFLNTATQARAQVVKVGGGLRQVQIPAKTTSTDSKGAAAATPASPASPAGAASDDESTATPTSATGRPPLPQLTINSSPFVDPAEEPTPPTAKSAGHAAGLGAVAEEDEEHDARPADAERGTSPFGDEHATK